MKPTDSYEAYRRARDAAWQTLLQLSLCTLPVDVYAAAARLGVKALPFPPEGESPLLAALLHSAGDAAGVSVRIRGEWHVFLRPGDAAAKRFALAHELGHIVLGHASRFLRPGVRAFYGVQNAGDVLDAPESPDDYAADIFALRLLAPACVLHAMHIDSPGDIARLCGLPPRAAAFRAERMALLNQRDAYLIHPLEKRVSAQFEAFVRSRPPRFAAMPRPPAREAPLLFPLPPGAAAGDEAQIEASPGAEIPAENGEAFEAPAPPETAEEQPDEAPGGESAAERDEAPKEAFPALRWARLLPAAAIVAALAALLFFLMR